MNRFVLFVFASFFTGLPALCQTATSLKAATDEAEVIDTVTVFDPVTGMEMYAQTRNIVPPHHLNGKKVYGSGEVTTVAKLRENSKGQSPEKYVLSSLSRTFASFPNGRYRVYANYVVVDKKGRCIHNKVGSVKRLGRLYMPTAFPSPDDIPADPEGTDTTFYGYQNMGCDTTELISAAVSSLLCHPHTFKPARTGRKKVTAIYNLYTERFDIVVSNGVVSIQPNAPIMDKGGLMESLENQNHGDWHMIKFLPRATPSSPRKD